MDEEIVRLDKTNQIDAHVGRRMRRRRESLGVSQSRLGQRLGLTFSQVQKYENGSNRIGAGRLYQMGCILGVPVQYFYEGLDEGPRTSEGDAIPDAAELALLDDAFRLISDAGTRSSLVALVRSLADQTTRAEGPPRPSTRRLRPSGQPKLGLAKNRLGV